MVQEFISEKTVAYVIATLNNTFAQTVRYKDTKWNTTQIILNTAHV